METKQFNKGLAFFFSLIISFLIVFLMYQFCIYATGGNIETFKQLNIILAVIVGIYAMRKKMIPGRFQDKMKNEEWMQKNVKHLKTLPLLYPLWVYFFPMIGLPCFFYDLFKEKAKEKGIEIDTKKNGLFWLSFVIWLGVFCITLRAFLEIIFFH